MATDKPRFSITVSDDVYQQINDYQHEHRLATQTKAVLAFIEKGLEVIKNEKKPPTQVIEVEEIAEGRKGAPDCHEPPAQLSPAEQAHIKKYRSLDQFGQEAVDGILDVEYRRCTASAQSSTEEGEKNISTVTLPQPYAQVAAAEGAGAFLLDSDFDEIEVELNDYTVKADTILKVVGRSMEPAIFDGDWILVREQPSVNIGEIGVFILDGQGYLKECAEDRLVSLNPAVEDVYIHDLQHAECYGKFIKVLDPRWIIEK